MFAGISTRPARQTVLLFAVSLMARLLYLGLVSQNMNGDELWGAFYDTQKYLQIVEYFKTWDPQYKELLLLAGPGYALILLVVDFFASGNVWAHVTLQALLSALSSVMIFRLAVSLQLPKRVAYLAGYIHAFSLTAIYLSASMLTETWFVFVSLLALVTFLRAYREDSILLYTVAVLCVVFSAMIRSLGQFYPFIIALVVFVPALKSRVFDRISLWRPLGFAALALFLILLWPVRNYVVHDIFTVSETGTRAARLYWTASAVGGSSAGANVWAVRAAWEDEISERFAGKTPTPREMHDFDVSVIRDTLSARTADMLGAYANAAWSNAITPSVYHTHLAPQPATLWGFYNQMAKKGLGKINFALTLIGLLILAFRRDWFAVTTLGSLWALFTLTSGVTFWQGSRIYFPAMMAWAPLAALALNTGFAQALSLSRRLRSDR